MRSRPFWPTRVERNKANVRFNACSDTGADTAHPLQLLDVNKRTVERPVVDDALRQTWPDARQQRELGRIRSVHINANRQLPDVDLIP